MLEEGLVRRDEQASPQVCRAARSRVSAGKRLFSNLIKCVYDGMAVSPVMNLVRSTWGTPKELSEVRRILNKMEKTSCVT